jgi:hypothetical protein
MLTMDWLLVMLEACIHCVKQDLHGDGFDPQGRMVKLGIVLQLVVRTEICFAKSVVAGIF